MIKVQKLINTYLFKQRYVYDLTYIEKTDMDLLNTKTRILKGIDILQNKEFFDKTISLVTLQDRSVNENVFCLVCFNNNNELIGYFWGLVASKKTWHDNIPIDVGNGFLFNGYVNPHYRGKNVFPYLIYQTSEYMNNNYRVNKVFDVVEKQNISSIKSHDKISAELYSKNYLIKLLGKNIISIYQKKIYLLFRKR